MVKSRNSIIRVLKQYLIIHNRWANNPTIRRSQYQYNTVHCAQNQQKAPLCLFCYIIIGNFSARFKTNTACLCSMKNRSFYCYIRLSEIKWSLPYDTPSNRLVCSKATILVFLSFNKCAIFKSKSYLSWHETIRNRTGNTQILKSYIQKPETGRNATYQAHSHLISSSTRNFYLQIVTKFCEMTLEAGDKQESELLRRCYRRLGVKWK